MKLLKFSHGNGKLSNRLIFSLPAGYTCRQAGVCKTLADRTTGKIKDLPMFDNTLSLEYRCFAAMSETRPNVRNARWHNWELLRQTERYPGDPIANMGSLIELSLFANKVDSLVRIHESGDFYSLNYLKAWLWVASNNPSITFYAYTKELNFWLQVVDTIPSNFYLTASVGGRLDQLLSQHPSVFQRIAHVVYTEQEATDKGLEIDHDDSHCLGDKPFALLVHGSQRAGTNAQKAITQRKKNGEWVGYNSKTSQLIGA